MEWKYPSGQYLNAVNGVLISCSEIRLATPPTHGCGVKWKLTASVVCSHFFFVLFLSNMAGDLRSFALEKAELLSSRLRELVSSGQGLVRAQFGVDLGLKPELYPSWLILSTAAVGLLLPLLLGASWAAFCGGGGGRLVGKKRASQVSQGGEETGKASTDNKSVKPEEPKKRNRKKTGDKVRK